MDRIDRIFTMLGTQDGLGLWQEFVGSFRGYMTDQPDRLVVALVVLGVAAVLMLNVVLARWLVRWWLSAGRAADRPR